MIYLLTTATGEERLIGSQQESLSGGALQFYLRISGDLRLQVAYAPGTWKSVSRIPKEQAQLLISQGIEHDKATLLHIEGRLDKPTAHASDQGATGPRPVSQAAPATRRTAAQATGEFKTRPLGNDRQGRKLSIHATQYGIKLKAQPRGGSDADAIWIKFPTNLDPATITLGQAIEIVENYKPPRRRSS